MQIVIDIPDRIYKIVQNRTLNITDDEILENALKNGTPLPKGHGRLIDADTTIKSICGNNCGCNLEECGRDFPCYSVQRINSALTIIEADKAEGSDKE